jgi:hypothetical protein
MYADREGGTLYRSLLGNKHAALWARESGLISDHAPRNHFTGWPGVP